MIVAIYFPLLDAGHAETVRARQQHFRLTVHADYALFRAAAGRRNCTVAAGITSGGGGAGGVGGNPIYVVHEHAVMVAGILARDQGVNVRLERTEHDKELLQVQHSESFDCPRL